MPLGWNAWVRRARHDLIKRLLWPARDRRDLGGPVRPGELVAELVDEEGRPATPQALWAGLRAEAPAPARAALSAFELALLGALAAAERDDLDGVLALQAAFDRLVQDLAGEE